MATFSLTAPCTVGILFEEQANTAVRVSGYEGLRCKIAAKQETLLNWMPTDCGICHASVELPTGIGRHEDYRTQIQLGTSRPIHEWTYGPTTAAPRLQATYGPTWTRAFGFGICFDKYFDRAREWGTLFRGRSSLRQSIRRKLTSHLNTGYQQSDCGRLGPLLCAGRDKRGRGVLLSAEPSCY